MAKVPKWKRSFKEFGQYLSEISICTAQISKEYSLTLNLPYMKGLEGLRGYSLRLKTFAAFPRCKKWKPESQRRSKYLPFGLCLIRNSADATLSHLPQSPLCQRFFLPISNFHQHSSPSSSTTLNQPLRQSPTPHAFSIITLTTTLTFTETEENLQSLRQTHHVMAYSNGYGSGYGGLRSGGGYSNGYTNGYDDYGRRGYDYQDYYYSQG